LKERDIDILRNKLNDETTDQNPNFKLLQKSIKEQKYEEVNGQIELVSGYRGAGLEGSSRSGKTWSCRDIIWLLILRNQRINQHLSRKHIMNSKLLYMMISSAG
jgi:hypothetical protein